MEEESRAKAMQQKLHQADVKGQATSSRQQAEVTGLQNEVSVLLRASETSAERARQEEAAWQLIRDTEVADRARSELSHAEARLTSEHCTRREALDAEAWRWEQTVSYERDEAISREHARLRKEFHSELLVREEAIREVRDQEAVAMRERECRLSRQR